MKLFSALYDRVLHWAKHPHAERYLATLSFAESSFFPIPPDVMMIPMVLSRPEKGWWLASLTTLFSVLGGIAGYFIGLWGFELVEPIIHQAGYGARFERVVEWFGEWGIWVVFIAGFSPIPYKLFTISAGMLQMMFIPFIIASFIGRGGRFYLVAGLIRWGGEGMEQKLRHYIDRIGWTVVALIVIGIMIYQFR
ncbi:MAG: DedA family protein [Gammaproteobacteria bacterium]|nr:DedA family protein [Gammaproteobacteria bacterium]